MVGIVVDPNNFDRVKNYADGIELCKKFLDANKMRHPVYLGTTNLTSKWGKFGYYRPETVHVNVQTTLCPVKNPVRSWTFTGWKSDLTAAGVTAHETGHHVDFLLSKTVIGELDPISSYSNTNRSESFAEALRLYILNPNLLYCMWPHTYERLSSILVPVVTLTWREVLANAHPRFIEVAEKRIVKTLRQQVLDLKS